MHLFTYGLLVIPEIMSKVSGKSFRFEEASLAGYARFKVKDQVNPAILPFPDRITEGLVYYDIDEETLAILDRFVGSLYERVDVNPRLMGDEWVEAQAYVIKLEKRTALLRSDWDEEYFRETYLKRFLEVESASDLK